MNNNQQYTIYGPAGHTIDAYGTAEKALERDGLFGYSCGMDYIVVERVNP